MTISTAVGTTRLVTSALGAWTKIRIDASNGATVSVGAIFRMTPADPDVRQVGLAGGTPGTAALSPIFADVASGTAFRGSSGPPAVGAVIPAGAPGSAAGTPIYGNVVSGPSTSLTISWSQTYAGVGLPGLNGIVYSVTNSGKTYRLVAAIARPYGSVSAFSGGINIAGDGIINDATPISPIAIINLQYAQRNIWIPLTAVPPPYPFVGFSLQSCTGCAVGSGVTATAFLESW